MEIRSVQKGENLSLPAEIQRIQLVVGWSDPNGDREVDASALLLNADHRVRSDGDLVFYNQTESPEGSVRHLGKANVENGTQEILSADLESIPEEVVTIAITASVDRGHFGDLDALRLVVLDGTREPIVRYDIPDAGTETAFVFGEVYRRNGAWKFRAVGQGWDTGLAGLATDFGVVIDDEPDTAEPDPTVVGGASDHPTDPLGGADASGDAQDGDDSSTSLSLPTRRKPSPRSFSCRAPSRRTLRARAPRRRTPSPRTGKQGGPSAPREYAPASRSRPPRGGPLQRSPSPTTRVGRPRVSSPSRASAPPKSRSDERRQRCWPR